MRIRDARDEELDEAAAVVVAAYRQYAPLVPPALWAPYERNNADVRSRLPMSELIVAEDEGRILGAVTFYPDGSRSEGEGWPADFTGIRLLAVHPDGRGRGLGRLLTDECIRRSRERGARALALHTTEFMAVAKAMYERMGFQRAPEFDMSPGPGIVALAYRFDL